MSESPPLIAVVDDDESVRRALERLLRSAGFDVVTFREGAAFLDSVESGRRVDCVILDLHMPRMGGLDVLLRLIEARRRLPAVVITGKDTPESQRRATGAGAVAYFRKPVDDKALIAAVVKGIAQNRSL